MVDTNVLGYAIFAPPVGDDDGEVQNMREDSRALLNQLQMIHVSAITWLEIKRMRRFHPKDQAVLDGYKRRLIIHSVDLVIAEASADLLENYGKDIAVCTKCFNPKGPEPCKKCKAMKSKAARINDAIVVATASEVTQVETLYSYDGGVIMMGKSVSGCQVMPPPHRIGPLFARGEEKAKAGSVLTLPSESLSKAGEE
jgi:predicted nucleic acid-binding protein